jgi:glycosyltransferase involved in cell wall biosynthesis
MSLVGLAVAEPFKTLLRPGGRLLKQLRHGRFEPVKVFRELWRFEPEYPWLVAREVHRLASVVFVLTGSEEATLRSKGIRERVVRIPHFVEDLPSPPAAVPSRKSDQQTVIVAGFIFGSKGHALVVEAMPLVPEVKVVFLGGPSIGSSPMHRDRLLELARRNGVQDRLEVTGYLPDAEYLDRIYNADLGLCPFSADKSASGSLATLIAAGCPVLASDIAPVAEFNTLVPGAIRTFQPYTAEALARAIRATLATPRATLVDPLAKLRALLSISAMYEQHLREYRQVLGVDGEILSRSV